MRNDSELNGFDKRRQPNGEITFYNSDGSYTKFYTAQCVHCGLFWTVVPGSGRTRGFCYGCNGMLCGGYFCMTNCEYVEKMFERQEKGIFRGHEQVTLQNGIWVKAV